MGLGGLDKARRVQQAMLPQVPVLPGLDVSVVYEPCDDVGGDFYDFIPISSEQIGIVVADASGHGVEAALMMAVAKKALHIHGRGRTSPKETMVKAARELVDDLPTSGFITCFYGIVHLKTMELRYVSAGHNPPCLCNQNGVQALPSRGIVINRALKDAMADKLEEKVIQLNHRDRLLVHTDGITEYASNSKEFFGEERLMAVLGQRKNESAEEMLDRVCKALDIFADDAPQQDDITMLALRVTEPTTVVISEKPKSGPETNIDWATNVFVGRKDELEELGRAVESGQKLVAIHGPPGIGKSRLATEAARRLADSFDGGIRRVDVSDTRKPADLEARVAAALRIPAIDEGSTLEAIGSTLSGLGKFLLILDGYDKLLSNAEDTIAAWLETAPNLHVWVTSRALPFMKDQLPLKLKGLSTSSDGEAVALLRERTAKTEAPGVQDETPELVGEICELLEGNPQALEVAASRMNDSSPQLVLGKLRSTLVNDRPSQDEVSTTAFEFAMDGSEAWEKQCVSVLCLFPGEFPSDIARRVLREVPGLQGEPEDLLRKLSDACLVTGSNSAFGTRYRLANVARLQPAAEVELPNGCKLALALSYAVFARKRAVQLDGSRSLEAAEWFSLEQHNLPVALQAAVAAGQPAAACDIAEAMLRWADLGGSKELYQQCVEAIGEDTSSPELNALRRLASAKVASAAGKWRVVFREIGRALEAVKTVSPIRALLLLQAGLLYSAAGRHTLAQRHLMGASRAYHALHDPRGRSSALQAQADDAYHRNEFGEALRYADRSAEQAMAGAATRLQLRAEALRARALCGVGRYHESLRILRRLKDSFDGLMPPMRKSDALLLEGEIRSGLEQHSKARKCFRRAAEADLELGGSWTFIRAMLGLVWSDAAARSWTDSLKHADEAIEFARRRRTATMLAQALLTEGQILIRRGDMEAGLQRFEQSAGALDKMELVHDDGRTSTCMAVAYQALCLAKLGRAREALNRAEFAARKLDMRGRRAIQTMFLCKCAQALAQQKGRDARAAAQAIDDARRFARKHELTAGARAEPHVEDAYKCLSAAES